MGSSQSSEASTKSEQQQSSSPPAPKSPLPAHDRSVPDEGAEDSDDPVDCMLRKAGCLELHYNVQSCMSEHKDWRQCQGAVEAFKQCMASSTQRNVVQAAKEESS